MPNVNVFFISDLSYLAISPEAFGQMTGIISFTSCELNLVTTSISDSSLSSNSINLFPFSVLQIKIKIPASLNEQLCGNQEPKHLRVKLVS